MDRLFLDANILFSAAYREESALQRLWELADAILVTSGFALEEARRNLDSAAQAARLERLASSIELVSEAASSGIPSGVELHDKDEPILAAAISTACTHLITGDRRHFGRFLGETIEGVLVLTPRNYLDRQTS